MAGQVCCWLAPPPGVGLAPQGLDAAQCQAVKSGQFTVPPNWTVTFVNSPLCQNALPAAPPGGGPVTGYGPTPPAAPLAPPPPPVPLPIQPAPAPSSGAGLLKLPGAGSQPVPYGYVTPFPINVPNVFGPTAPAAMPAGACGTGAPTAPAAQPAVSPAPSPTLTASGQLMLCQPLPGGAQY